MHRQHPEPPDQTACRELALRSFSRHVSLSPAQVEWTHNAVARTETAPPNQELIAEGTAPHSPYLLLDGWAVEQRILHDGRRQIFRFLLPGDLMGLGPRQGTAARCGTMAATRVAYAALPAMAEAMQLARPDALADLGWRMIGQAEAELRDQVVRLGRQSARERLAHLLLGFYDRLEMVGLADANRFQMPLSQELLSDALGLSVVHTNRVLQQFRHENLIETRGAWVRLIDMPVLNELAGASPAPSEPSSPQHAGPELVAVR